MKRLTIYDMKYRTLETAPHFFARKTLKFFGQTMRDFSVRKLDSGKYEISAPIFMRADHAGAALKPTGHHTVRIFNPETNALEYAR